MDGPRQSSRAIGLPCIHVDVLLNQELRSLLVLLLDSLNQTKIGRRRGQVDRQAGQAKEHSTGRYRTQDR